MKKFVQYSVNLIVAIAMISMFSESSYALNKNVLSINATQADAISVSKTSIAFGPAASTDTFSIVSSVSWVVTSSQTWLTFTPASGSNNGVVYVAASANTGTASRTGTITVSAALAGSNTTISKIITVTQTAQTPSTYLNVSRTSITLSSYLACTDTFAITSNTSWTVSITANSSGTGTIPTWLTVTPTSGSNNAIINIAAVANTTTSARYAYVVVTSGTISKSVVVIQPAAAASYLNVSRTNISLSYYNACTDTFSISSNVSWTIAISSTSSGTSGTIPTWLTVTPTSGSNNAVVNIAAIANTTNVARTAYIIVTSGTISKVIGVTQPAAPAPYLNVSRTNITLPSYNACTDSFAITSNVNWTITLTGNTASGGIYTTPTWLTVTPTSGSNNLTCNIAAEANTTNAARYAYLVIVSGTLSRTITVTQPAAPVPVSYLYVSRTSITLPSYNACTDTFAITSNVAWTVSINGGTSSTTIPTWLTVTPTSGSMNGVVTISAVANTTNAARTAYIVVASGTISKTITVTQPAAPVTYLNVSRTNITLSTYLACTDTFSISSNVNWTITISGSTASGGIVTIPTWITVSPTSGSNNGVINIAAVANTTTTARIAYIIVTSGTLSKTIMVTQPAAPPTPYLNVSRTSIALSTYNACTDTFAITSNVSWTVSIASNSAGSSNTTSWLTATPTSGSNNLTVNIAATANTTNAARTAYITVSSGTLSKTITVTQPANPPAPYLNVSRTSITLATYNACADTFAITSNASWTITTSSTTSGTGTAPTWLTVTPTSGSNNAVINVAAVANTTTSSRYAVVIVTSGTLSKSVVVTQPAAPAPYLNVSRTSITLASYNACADTFAITSNGSWTITTSSTTSGTGTAPTWLTVTPTSGSNNAVINVAAIANTTTATRTASIVVASGTLSKTITVTQPGAPAPYLNVSRTSIALSTYNACTDTFAITSNASWTITVSSNSAGTGTAPTWLTVTPTSGTNNAVINVAAAANTTTSSRYAVVIVTSGTLSKSVVVTQPAAPTPYLNVSRTSITLSTYLACTDTFTITSNVSWTIAINGGTASSTIPTWFTVTPTTGSNNSIITITALANTTNAARTAYIVVASGTISKTITVTQPSVPASYLNVSRTSITLPSYNACTDTFKITSNVNWTVNVISNTSGTASTIPTWLTVTPTTGSNNAVINIVATANTTTVVRTAYIQVTSGNISKIITVKQNGISPNPGLQLVENNSIYSSNNDNKTVDNSVVVYPNPTKDYVVIKPQQQFTNSDYIEIYSLDGTKVLTQILNGSNARIDLQSLKNGIYFLRITQNNGVVVKTINKY